MGQLLKRQEEFIRYALFGIAAVAADVLVYALTVGHLGIRLANALSWLAALVAAFITNKYWVFHRGKEGPALFSGSFLNSPPHGWPDCWYRSGAPTHWFAKAFSVPFWAFRAARQNC